MGAAGSFSSLGKVLPVVVDPIALKPGFEVRLQAGGDVSTIPFELQTLSAAVRYQEWLIRRVYPYLGQSILEIGSGIGNLSRWLPVRENLILSEMDPDLYRSLESATDEIRKRNSRVQTIRFDLTKDNPDVFSSSNIDTIVSFNVLEHIADDFEALRAQVSILRHMEEEYPKTRGFRRIVTLVPAHPCAYGELDRKFGHYRRYSKKRILELHRDVCPEAGLEIRFMNFPGLLGWWFQGRVLKKSEVGPGWIRAFEALCPWIRPLDDWVHDYFHLSVGQSVFFVMNLPMKGKFE